MSNYGRNFEFRIAPQRGQRNGRYVNDSAAAIPLGTPVAVTSDPPDALGREGVEPVTGATQPKRGTHGIILVEHIPPTGMAGSDPFLTTYSDIDTAPVGEQVMLVSGDEVKVVLRNTEARTFLNTRDYPGRVMVAGIGATPTLEVGDYLTPGVGDDTDGYWAETATEAEAWLVVTAVDLDRGEVEARLMF